MRCGFGGFGVGFPSGLRDAHFFLLNMNCSSVVTPFAAFVAEVFRCCEKGVSVTSSHLASRDNESENLTHRCYSFDPAESCRLLSMSSSLSPGGYSNQLQRS